MTRVLFACVHNAGRSQMAAAFFNQLANSPRAHALSAGTAPVDRVHPEVVDAMREVGVEIAGATPQWLTDDLAASVDILVTMGCGESCPVVPGVKRLDWSLKDPKGLGAHEVAGIRDEIRNLVASLIAAERLGG